MRPAWTSRVRGTRTTTASIRSWCEWCRGRTSPELTARKPASPPARRRSLGGSVPPKTSLANQLMRPHAAPAIGSLAPWPATPRHLACLQAPRSTDRAQSHRWRAGSSSYLGPVVCVLFFPCRLAYPRCSCSRQAQPARSEADLGDRPVLADWRNPAGCYRLRQSRFEHDEQRAQSLPRATVRPRSARRPRWLRRFARTCCSVGYLDAIWRPRPRGLRCLVSRVRHRLHARFHALR